MFITTTSLTRGAGLSAVVAGLLFIVIQLIHPHEDVAAVTTTGWIVVALLTMAMSVLLLVGLTGMYLRQVTETGLPGLVGFLLFGSTFVLTIAVTFVEVFVLPRLADQSVPITSRTSSPPSPAVPSSATSGPCRWRVWSLRSATCSAVCCSVSFCTELGSSARWASLLLAVGSFARRSWSPSCPMPSTG